MRSLVHRLARILASLRLSCALLVLLGLLTWLGTLEQVHTGLYEVQKKYFESYLLVHRAGPVPIPLPGANLVLSVLFVNLLVGGVVRLRRSWSTAGILTTHLGIAFLLLSGFVKLHYSEDGHVTLYEGERANTFQSYYRWELAVLEPLPGTSEGRRVREHLVPQEDLADARGAAPVRVASAELPFELELRHFMANCRPLPKGPMFDVDVPVVDGVFLERRERVAQAEANLAGVYVTVVDRRDGTRREGVLWGADRAPFTVVVDGRDWAVDLRKERYPMPFTLALDDFTKVDHPRSAMPKAFSSDVTVIDGGAARPVEISMNEPLRQDGLVVYQASWGPSTARPGDPLFSTFSVVRNPADSYPLYACVVVALGLTLHFSRRLVRFVRREARAS